MMLKTVFLTDNDKDIWNNFILGNRGSFLQSFEWGLVQEKMGRKIWRMWLVDEKISKDRPIFACQIIKHDLPFGKSYLYSPHGPIFQRGIIEEIGNIYKSGDKNETASFIEKKKEYFADFLKAVADICKQENAFFYKMEPVLKSELHKNYLLASGLKMSGKEIQPSETIIIDLEKSEEELLAEMKSKTRYNIRLAEKHGVKIREASGEKDFEKFFKLMKETAGRDEFHLHSQENYKNTLQTNTENFKNKLFLAEFDNQVLAGAMANFFNGKAVYLHGASSSSNRNVMAPYLLQWEIIKRAKATDMRQYDLWGISDKWPGVTRFKQGFGGKEIKYLGAFDLVVDKKWYWVYSLMRKMM